MRIGMVTSGRFHIGDLARELSRRGHEVKFYSLVPPMLTRKFGLPDECNRWLGRSCAAAYIAARAAVTEPWRRLSQRSLLRSIDDAAVASLEPCDVLIAMSGIGVQVLDHARRRFGARIFLERSSRHILSQREILTSIPGTDPRAHARFDIDRELVGYALADTIAVPAAHVHESFLEHDFPAKRLFLNPFGVQLETFTPTLAPPTSTPTVLMTGAWSLRKGCDVLTAAWRRLPGVNLLHVGPVVDAELPRSPGFRHVDAVPQASLPTYYAQAHVFALASREEGLACVQVQALASGLRLVCTTRTGGADLRRWTADPESIDVVPPDDVDALADALRRALSNLPRPGTVRDCLGVHRQELSWSAYAARYEQRMLAALDVGLPALDVTTLKSS